MSTLTLEERVTMLEAEIKQMKQEEAGKESKAPLGWKHIIGIFADAPEFEEAMQYGQEWREAQRPSGEESLA